ncbi:MAG: hypothetical protein DHS20C14_08600 [Phycisphaeraceae bacterium]|nr:MAG: hypothetical protein DHS20C14_08600 [Phycisphaeraceae bacterium]
MNLIRFVAVVGCAFGVAAGAALSAPADGTTEQDKALAQVIAKGEDSHAARQAMVNQTFSETRGPLPVERVIYGADDRREVYEYDVLDPTLRAMSEACAVVVSASSVFDNGDGTYTLSTSPWTSAGGTLCAEEPFRGQPAVGFCSSFLVGPDIITTAGHCVDAGDVSSGVAFVFGFQLNDEDETGPTIVPADWVYFGTSIINQVLSGGDDHSVVQLDRPVVGITPVPIRRTGVVPTGTPLAVIGHPQAILKKIAGGAEVKANQTGFFQSNLDTYGGNSGSMVVNLNTYEVEGILVRGAPDFTTVGGCVVSNQVPDTGNTGGGLPFEECSVTTTFEASIPPLGITVSPGGTTTHFGVVGGPFTSPGVVYTLDNTTSDPADYVVALTNAAAGVLIDGGTSDVTGTLAGNSSTTVTVTLDNTTVNGFAAGVYSTDVTFDDTTNSIGSTASHVVEVGQTLVSVSPTTALISGGPEGGPFPGGDTYTITSLRPTAVDVLIEGPDWVEFNLTRTTTETASLSGTGDSADLTVTFGGTAASLAPGLYTDELVFTNLDNADEIVVPVVLDVGRYIYPSTDTPIAINDNSTFTSDIIVTEAFCVGDIDVDVDINHTFSGDLIITLTSPEGTDVVLHNEGGSSDDFTARRYDDDDAANFLAEGPGMLADFEFEIVTGVWTLTVEDDAGGDTGTLNSWTLRVASSGETCPPAAADLAFIVDENHQQGATLSATSLDPIDTYTITSLPTKGIIWDSGSSVLSVPHDLSGDTITYRANPTETGADSFTYTATAAGLTSPDASVGVTIDAITGPATLHEFNLDIDPAWSTDGDWAWGVPTGQGGGGSSGPDPTSGYTGANVYGYNLNGNYTDNMAPMNLTSDALDISGQSQVVVSFRRWLGMESSSFDQASFQISVDAGAFETVWAHAGGSFGDDAWTAQSYDVSSSAAGGSTLTLRWVIGPTDGSVTYPGWNLDDIEVGGDNILANPADLDQSLALNVDDIDAFVTAFIGSDCLADLDANGMLNVDDIDAFVDYFINGP